MKHIFIFILIFLARDAYSAESDLIAVDMTGKLSLTKDISLTCDSVQDEKVSWISSVSVVILEGNSYECRFARSAQKEGVTKCSQAPKTELAKNETRNFKIVQVENKYAHLDFSTSENALIFLCKAPTGSSMKKLSVEDFKKIVKPIGVDIQKMEKSGEVKVERIKYTPPVIRRKSDLISI